MLNIKAGDINKEVLDIYEYRTVNNAINYHTSTEYNSWNIYTHDNTFNNRLNILVIDCIYSDAFCHWVYESAIYLPLFNLLRPIYPNIKLHLKGQKKYKELFCRYFNISNTDVIYELPSNNTCIFPLPISCLNNKDICDTYKIQVNRFISYFTNKDTSKITDVLFMPRQVKENYICNDRTYDTTDILNTIMTRNNSYILNTDNTEELSEQVISVQTSKNIVLTAGSPYFVNGMFTSNSNIIVLDDFNLSQIQEFKKMDFLHNIIKTNNTVHIVPKESPFTFNHIKDLLL